MNTQYAVLTALAIGLVGIMFSMSGVNAVFGGQAGGGALADEANASADNASVGEDFSSDTRSEGSVIGFVISGAEQVANLIGLVVGLPLALEDLGFPTWFAYPVGLATQLIVSIGFVQFIAGRVYR